MKLQCYLRKSSLCAKESSKGGREEKDTMQTIVKSKMAEVNTTISITLNMNGISHPICFLKQIIGLDLKKKMIQLYVLYRRYFGFKDTNRLKVLG